MNEKRDTHLSSLQNESENILFTLSELERIRAKLVKEITLLDTDIIQQRLDLEKKNDEIRIFKEKYPGEEKFP